MDVKLILNQVKNGEITIEEAEKLFRDLPYEDIGFAKLDHHRALRLAPRPALSTAIT